MNRATAKAAATLIASIMSFLGWSVLDYGQYLPEEIGSKIQFEAPKDIAPRKENAPRKQAPKASIKQVSLPKANPLTLTPPKAPELPKSPAQNQPVDLSASERITQSTINILCTMQKSNMIAKYTGSGVFIDPQGIILTNAHVAEHVMLAGLGFESCTIRTGSPAKSSYKAKVIYLPDAWIQNNKNNLSAETITGTGESDYALLLLTEIISKNAPNVPLVYLPMSERSVASGDSVTLAGYPAGFGDVALLDSALYLLQRQSQIKSIFGFTGNGSDVLDTSPTPLAEHGSSGGAMVADDGKLVGIMDSVIRDNTGQSAIQGISISYIKNSILQNTGKSLSSFIENAKSESDNFLQTKAPVLASQLMSL